MRLDSKVFVKDDRGAMTALGQEGVSGTQRSLGVQEGDHRGLTEAMYPRLVTKQEQQWVQMRTMKRNTLNLENADLRQTG